MITTVTFKRENTEKTKLCIQAGEAAIRTIKQLKYLPIQIENRQFLILSKFISKNEPRDFVIDNAIDIII